MADARDPNDYEPIGEESSHEHIREEGSHEHSQDNPRPRRARPEKVSSLCML